MHIDRVFRGIGSFSVRFRWFIVVAWLVAAGPLVAEAAQAGLKVSPLAQILLIVLVLGAGTDYGLFLVFRVREQLRGGMEPETAEVR